MFNAICRYAGIECYEESGYASSGVPHAWNKVKLGGKWYNWDMTNVASESLSISKMGKCLKNDYDLNDSMYENSNSHVPCIHEPSTELIEEINQKIKSNIKRRIQQSI